MKYTHIKGFLLLLVISVLSFTACKKSSSNSSTSIEGKWYAKSQVQVENNNGTVTNNSNSYSGKTTLVFNSNGTYVLTPDVTSTADVNDWGDTPGNGTWSVTGTSLTIDGTPASIKTLTSSSLVIYIKTTTGSNTLEQTMSFTR